MASIVGGPWAGDMSRCTEAGCDCSRFVATFVPNECALCRHLHVGVGGAAPGGRGSPGPRGSPRGQQVQRRGSVSQIAPPRPSIPAPSTLPTNELLRQQTLPILPPRPAKAAAPTRPLEDGRIKPDDPRLPPFFHEFDLYFKQARNGRGLTKRESNRLLESGVLRIKNGQIEIDTEALMAMNRPSSSPTAQAPPPVGSATSRPRLKVPGASVRPAAPIATPQRVLGGMPNSQRLQAENKALRSALEQEKAARKAAEFRNESSSHFERRTEALQNRVNELDNRIAENNATRAELESKCRFLEDSILDLEARSKDTSAGKDRQLTQIQEKYNYEHQLRTDSETQLTRLYSELGESRSQCETLLLEKDALEDSIRTQQESFREKISQIEQYSQSQLKDLKKKLESEELARLETLRHSGADSSSYGANSAQFEELNRASGEQMRALTKQYEEAESARNAIATQNLELQFQFADAIELYETRLMEIRRQISSMPDVTRPVELLISALAEVLQPIQARAAPLDRKKDSNLLTRVTKLNKEIGEATARLSQNLDSILDVEQVEKNMKSLLGMLESSRSSIQSAMKESRIAHHALLREEVARLQQELSVERELRYTAEQQAHQPYGRNSAPLGEGERAELLCRLEEEMRTRQRMEEETQQLYFQLNTLQVVDANANSLQVQLQQERETMNQMEMKHHRYLVALQQQLDESRKHCVNLESTKEALESTLEMLSQSSGTPNSSSLEEAIKEERGRARKETETLQKRVEELQTRLQNAERLASAAATGQTWSEELNYMRSNMERALQENASLSLKLETATTTLRSMDMQAYEDFEMPLPPSAPPPPPPSSNMNEAAPFGAPPPPPPMGMPPLPPPSNGRANLFAQIQSSDRTGLKKPSHVPEEAAADSRTDLMAAIRGGSSMLRRVDPKEKEVDTEKFDPQNMMHALAKALFARREGLEDDIEEEEDGEDESWDA